MSTIELPVLKSGAPASFTTGNMKLGWDVLSWSIPAARTCPGATSACLSSCYALQGHYVWPSVQESHQRNFVFSQTSDFVDWAIAAIRSSGLQKVRVHAAGDFYGTDYIQKWVRIIQANKRVTFWGYTRSWRMKSFVPDLRRLASQRNMHLWLSVDSFAKKPPRIPRTRLAFLARTDEEIAAGPRGTDLIFRNLTSTVIKNVDGVQVCPAEIGAITRRNGEPYHMTCSKCGICFREGK